MSRTQLCILTGVMLLYSALWASVSSAVTCPAASLNSVCAELTEPTGVTNLKETVVTIKRDGVALAPVVVPASSPTGGAVQSVSIPTIACVSDTYTAEAYSNYNTSLGVMPSLVVTATPGVGIVKDRTSESPCLKVPGNFTVR